MAIERLVCSGPRDTDIVIVGEAPGSTEVQTGKPFTGGAGMVLDKMLSRVGVGRHECFITNLCHVQPPGNDFEWFYKKPNLMHYLQGIVQLKKDLEDIQPNIVVALGAHPLKALTGAIGVTKWRGSVLPCTLVKGLKVLSAYHPAAILRKWDYKGVTEYDLSKIVEERKTPELTYPYRTFYLPNGVVARRIGAEWVHSVEPYSMHSKAQTLQQASTLSVDIECVEVSPGQWKLDCIGFSSDPSWALVLDCHNSESRTLAQWLCKSPARKVLQNGTFDFTVLRNEGWEIGNFHWDTMLAHHALFAECASAADELSTKKKSSSAFGKGLAFLTSFYTKEPYYKDDGKLWKDTGDKAVFYRYNALDTAVTLEISQIQDQYINDFGVRECAQREFNLVEPLMAMTRRGLKIDIPCREEIKAKLTKEIENLQKFLNLGAGFEVNVKSSKDVFKLAYETLKLPERKNKKTGNTTADKDAIIYLAERYQHPVLMTILKIREKRDLIERYANAPIDSDGRMRCSFDITGTRSGRLSSRISIYGSGTNLQTIPEYMRRMFVADEGKVFIYRDFSQAEARVVAALSCDEYLISIFNDPTKDIHTLTAAAIFNKKPEDVTPEERQIGKKVRHAVNYGMDAGRFVEVVNKESEATGIKINFALAKKVIDGFFMLHPNHKTRFWGDVERQLRSTMTLRNPLGRKRVFYDRWSDAMLREAYSWIPQSTVGDLNNQAVINIYNDIELGMPETGAEVMLAVHDSILVQCNIDAVDVVNSKMAECMNIPFEVNGYTIVIPTDSKVGYNWGNKGKDGSNPQGLVKVA